MQFCTYGHGLLLLQVSETLFDIEHIIESKNGNLKAASEVLMDIHELKKEDWKLIICKNTQSSFFIVLTNILK